MGGRVWILWLRVLTISPLMKAETPREANLKGEGERWGGAWLQKAKRGWEQALSEYVECIIESWEAIAGGDQVWSFLLSSSYYHKSIQFYSYLLYLFCIQIQSDWSESNSVS